jgi:(+)-trans-carveol dehydrogenase
MRDGRLKGKVAYITGAARGIGRAQAVRMAEEGADLIIVDLGATGADVHYKLASQSDLVETGRQIQAAGGRALIRTADVRNPAALAAAADDGVREFGRLDIVSANAGIHSFGNALDMSEQTWRDMIDINLTGVFNTIRATVPHIRAGGRGGSVVITSSVAGLRPYAELSHYTASKHGVIGFARSLALELAPESIRVNTVNPTGVATDMILSPTAIELAGSHLAPEDRTVEGVGRMFQAMQALPVPWIEAVDVANATVFLVSDEARYITGIALPVDAGGLLK